MSLLNITPIDGRYSNVTKDLNLYFSEYSFIKYRLTVEIEYLITLGLHGLYELNLELIPSLRNLYEYFSVTDCEVIKAIELKTKHDGKAIELFIENFIASILGSDSNIINYVHFCLSSQDVTSFANILMIKDAIDEIIFPKILRIKNKIKILADNWSNLDIVSKLHCSNNISTNLGKQMMVFYERLENQINILNDIEYRSMFGDTEILDNDERCNSKIHWDCALADFLKLYRVKRNKYTKDIDHYDNYSEIFDCLKRINTILIDLCKDIWLYITREIFIEKKQDAYAILNPVKFENSEGNLLLSNNMFEFFSNKLPVSRLQRDLTHSTILRNVGSAFGYSLIGMSSLIKGLDKITVNIDEIIDK